MVIPVKKMKVIFDHLLMKLLVAVFFVSQKSQKPQKYEITCR